MGFAVFDPSVIGFLEWLRREHPQLRSAEALQLDDRMKLARDFLRGGLESRRPPRVGPRRLAESITEHPSLFSSFRRGQLYQNGDLLKRYRTTQFRAVFLFSSQNEPFRTMLEKYWEDWSRVTADTLDFFDYTLRTESPEDYSFSSEHVRRLSPVPCADVRRIQAVGLPCMLLWSDADNLIVPFKDVADHPTQARRRFDEVLSLLADDRIDELKARYDRMVRDSVRSTAEVFISYNHKDRAKVQRLHDTLEDDGFETWFDEHLNAGDHFDYQIEHYLNHATATLVVWSEAATRSKWVRGEAMRGLYNDNLAQAVQDVDAATLPPPFNGIHAENLSSWPTDPAPYERLKRSLEMLRVRRGN